MSLSWMAWTAPTAAFFSCIFLMLVTMAIWSIRAPQAPRMGILRIETTPGDRLFISLLGSAFICLGWLASSDLSLLWAMPLCLLYALAVFRWV